MVLALLAERPMHPYEMQRLMVSRGNDQNVRVQRGSLYPAVERLERAGLIRATETLRDGRRPERTVYELTEEGVETGRDWLLEMLSTHRNEFPEFIAALSFTALVQPDAVLRALTSRRRQLRRMLAGLEAVQEDLDASLPRMFVIESEYRIAMLRAEHDWVDALVADLASGDLTWSAESIEAWQSSPAAATHEGISHDAPDPEHGPAT